MDEARDPTVQPPGAEGTLPDAPSRLAFLARASEALVAAPTHWTALERLAQLIVPTIADWCTIDVLDEAGRLTRVAVVHTDPAKLEIAAELERRYPPETGADYGISKVLRTGASELYPDISEEQLAATAADPEHLELIRKLGGFRSAMIVPLIARGLTLGAITFVSSDGGRRFTEEDLALAEAVARRGALAAANARLAEEVEETERKLENLVDSLDAIVWEADLSTRQFTFVSKPAEEILGYPTDRWVKEPGFWRSIVHEADQERAAEAYQRATAGDPNHDFEYRILAADGRTVWIRDLMFVVRDDDGTPKGMRGLMVDITERILAARRSKAEHAATVALAESKTLDEAAPRILQEIGENLGWDAGTVWLSDPAAEDLICHTAWSRPPVDRSEFEKMTEGFSFRSGVGLPGRVWMTGEATWIPDVAKDDNFPRRSIADKVGLHGALGFPIVLRGVVIGVLEFFSLKIRQPDDDLIATTRAIGTQIGQFIESTEAAAALRESHARGMAMLGAALDCFISMDHEGRIIEFNPAAERTFGYSRSDVIGRELAELIIPAADREYHRAGLARFLATGHGPMLDRRMEVTAMRSDDSEFPAELAVTVVDLDPPIFTGYVRDISEEKAAERALRDSRERLSFLAEASALLSSSLNFRTVLERLANLVVPSLADWCAVDVLEEDDTPRRVAVAHADPTKRDLARQLIGIRPDEDDGQVLRRVLATGEAVIAPDGFDACGGSSNDPERRRVISELGCRTAVVVPLVARGRTLGAMTLVSASDARTYGAADVTLVSDLARRAALAVDNARLYSERSHVARTLQRSLLPPHLPQIPGIDIAARYHAAGEGNEVGGDFYDLFRTGKDDWAIVIGDVCGKGADAAAVTALARYTLRAAAMQARKPSRVLGMLNEALLVEAASRDSMDQRFCTVAYARLRPAEGGVRITSTSGGHPVPLVLRADGTIEGACRVGTLIGVLPEPTLNDRSIALGTGDVMVLYTDGITEARGPEGVFGEDRLRELIASCTGLDASSIAERIERTVLDFQLGNPRDDIALMVLGVAAEDRTV
jgi:PAS domain S-box-containing protein